MPSSCREPIGRRISLSLRLARARADVNRVTSSRHSEGRALGHVFVEYQPDVVLDCHEFGVKTRWLEKFGGLQRYDALIQYATVSNLSPALTEVAETMFYASH